MTDLENISLPDQTFPTTTGEINLHALPQDWLVLYFYPKDSTPGCSVQATDFTALKSEFEQLNVQVIGVSRDSIKSHQNFTEKYQLEINLISDHTESLCNHFNVIKEKNMYGKKVLGIERSTFIFHKGKLVKAYRKVKAKEHAATVLEDIKLLQTP